MKPTILFLDDMPVRHQTCARSCGATLEQRRDLDGLEDIPSPTEHMEAYESANVWHVHTAEQAIRVLTEQEVDIVSLDHDLGGLAPGMVVVDHMVQHNEAKDRIIVNVHSMNPIRSVEMAKRLEDAGYSWIATLRSGEDTMKDLIQVFQEGLKGESQ